MNTLTKITAALALVAVAHVAGAGQPGSDQDAAQQFADAATGGHATESTDRGGKPAGDADASFAALLEWLLGHMDR